MDKKQQTPLTIAVPSFDKDFGQEILCSKIELNNSSSSSPSNGGCRKRPKKPKLLFKIC